MRNRSVPDATVIPVLSYVDVTEAAEWLCRVFGFRERLRIGQHRVQLTLGNGALVVTSGDNNTDRGLSHSVLVRVDDVDSHHRRAVAAGAIEIQPPADYPYGERQYTVDDIGGHRWTFSQSIADVDPADWGGTAVDLT